MKKYIIGIDEAGRGPLAGPVSVAAVAIPVSIYRYILKDFKEVKDSKQLSPEQREIFFKQIRKHSSGKVLVAVSLVGNTIIDKRGIVPAIRLALLRCLQKLEILPNECKIFLDGSLYAPKEYKNQKTIIRGDDTVKIISMASVIAKVYRDRHITRKAKEYPQYGFEVHKGYGTLSHRNAIKKHGISDYHRKSFLKSLTNIK